ncbi:MAG: hypothetical protein EA378_00115 [Phycisphaerales bacterium]|nr:MAG: hypothetical protein EA378_00115 [Phycisphaerales bacterium]
MEDPSGQSFGLREPIVSMEYNGLHWRTRRLKEDLAGLCVTSNPPPLLEERRYYYDAGWRLLEEHVLRCGSLSSTSQQVWGLRYIDDAVARRVDHNGNRSFTDVISADPQSQPHARDRTYGYITDHQFSVVAVVEVGSYIRVEGDGSSATEVPFAEVQEWVHDDPYGFAEHRRPGVGAYLHTAASRKAALGPGRRSARMHRSLAGAEISVTSRPRPPERPGVRCACA